VRAPGGCVVSLVRRSSGLLAPVASTVAACSTMAVWATLAVCSGLAVGVPALLVGQARGATILSYNAGAPVSSTRHQTAPSPHGAAHALGGTPVARPPGVPHAPSGPVLGSGVLAVEEASASAPSSGGDPLTGNGLDSPLCRQLGGLSASQQRSCQTDNFVAAPDPTNNYAFDVNINTGVSRWGNDMSATIDNFAQFGWMALVSATHGLVVMFEWCYSLNLLSDSLLREVTGALRNARLTFTEPWMVIVLAVASTLAVYHGLVRRRVAETMGQVLAMLAMMVGGLWVIADPAGTVGAVEQWANQAGLGTMAAVASGTPGHAERTLADNMQVIFASVVSTPWCYLEFGNVGWCDNARLLDRGLKNAGMAIAKSEEKKSGCRSTCGAGASPGTRTLSASAVLLREAQTNGELFLALPANEPQRNSVTREGTLLNILCGDNKSADECKGPMGPQAEFRSQKGTGSRVIGLFAIWLGALGMLLLLGYLALRLLGAALVGLFFLLLAPAAVLAPALGDGGRSAFRGWALKLMEAVIAKLTYSFLLGVVLMMMKLLLSLTILGWWGEWLLISAFWWGVFLKRHQTLGWAQSGGRGQAPAKHRSMARRVADTLEAPLALVHAGRALKGALTRPAPEVKPRPTSRLKPHTTIQPGSDKQSPADGGPAAGGPATNRWGGNGDGDGRSGEGGAGGDTRTRARAPGGEPVRRRRDHGLAGEQAAVQTALAGGKAAQAGQRGQLERVRSEREKAVANGDTRRAAKLGAREERIEGTRARRETLALAMVEPEPELEAGELAVSAVGGRHAGGKGPRNGQPGAGHSVGGHAHAVSPAGSDVRGRQAPGAGARGGQKASPSRSQSPPSSTAEIWQGSEQGDARKRARQSSSVMDDAREVAARRKRQLGWGPEMGRGPES
jgi:hypothetical protein